MRKFSELKKGDKIETESGEVATVLSDPEKGVLIGHLRVRLKVPGVTIRAWTEGRPNTEVFVVS